MSLLNSSLRTSRIVTSLVVAFASLLLAACDDRFPDYNYKMTVYVDGKAFSTVRRVEVAEGMSIVSREVEGEAIVIDHPNGKRYYALMSWLKQPDHSAFVAGAALRDHVDRPSETKTEVQAAVDEWFEQYTPQDSFGDAATFLQKMVKVEGPKDLPRMFPPRRNREPKEAWPLFVSFYNPANPMTVRKVAPEAIGVDRITIEITDEDVSNTGIEDILPYKGDNAEWRKWRESLPYGDWRGELSRWNFVQRPRD